MAQTHMMFDMNNRDPEKINFYVKASFESVIAETDVHSVDCGWKNSYLCFTHGRNIMYKFLTLVLGMPLALIWGMSFALFSFVMVWFCTPSIQLFKIVIQSIRSIISVSILTIIAPLYDAMGFMFSRINITINYGANDKRNQTANIYPSIQAIIPTKADEVPYHIV